jgi:hypothetical protein
VDDLADFLSKSKVFSAIPTLSAGVLTPAYDTYQP